MSAEGNKPAIRVIIDESVAGKIRNIDSTLTHVPIDKERIQ